MEARGTESTRETEPAKGLKKHLWEIFQRKSVPSSEEYLKKVRFVSNLLDEEEESLRPRDSEGRPGGLIYLKSDLPAIIVPDLHACMNYFLAVLSHRYEADSADNGSGKGNVLGLLAAGKLQIVCVGDGFHSEGRAAQRWLDAFEEFKKDFRKHSHMDEEMRESLGLMEMVMETKSCFPRLFHFLKGNHENIANENGNGNYPFGKFAYEGEMVARYIEKFYGQELLKTYYHFEKKLPLLAVGRNFLVSHAEPRRFYPKELIIDYHRHPEIIYDLTWTPDDGAEEGSVQDMLDAYLDVEDNEKTYLFGGHRTIKGRYNLRANERYVQIHNPNRFIIASIKPDRGIDLDRDILELNRRDLQNI